MYSDVGMFCRLFSGRIGLVGVEALLLRHIMFPVWLFGNIGICSHCLLCRSPHPHVSTKCVVVGVVVCEGFVSWLLSVTAGSSSSSFRISGERRDEEHRCKSLIFYLVAFFYNRINRKTSSTNKITVICYCTYD